MNYGEDVRVKKLASIKLTILFVLVMLSSVVIYLFAINPIEFKLSDIRLTKIEDTTFLEFMWDESSDGGKVKYELSSNETKEIASKPKDFRFVSIICDARNNSFMTLSDIRASVQPSEELSEIIIGKRISVKTWDEPFNLDSHSQDEIVVNMLVKSVGKTDEEIRRAAYNSDYVLTGNRDYSKTLLRYNVQK
jgi:hypothetical protein